MALVFACAAVLVGWLVYDQIGSGSAISRETTSAAQSRTFDARGREMPAAPPMPYRFTGTSSQGSVTQYLLAKDDNVFAVNVGAILDGVYRVESTSDDEIVLRYLPLGLRQAVPRHSAPWWPPAGAASATSVTPAESAPLPPAVQRTRSPALLDLSR